MRKMLWFAIMVLSTVFAVSCDNEDVTAKAVQQSDTVRVIKGFESIPSLIHHWDSLKLTQVKDEMDARLEIWRTQNGQRTEKAYDNTVHPTVNISSLLAREDYAISEEMVNIQPTSSTVLRSQVTEKDGTLTEVDTVRYWFPDQQVWSIPVRITNEKVKVGNAEFDFPSVTLVNHRFVHLKNTPASKTRGQYMSADYQTEYKSMLSFKETNIENPKTMEAPIYAFTRRYVMSNDDILKVTAENKNRVWIDTLTERCSFDRVSYFKSGEKLSETKEFILNHKFTGIDPYSKNVKNFEHKLTGSNGIAAGSESARESGVSNWSKWGKTDKYSANIENGVAADKIVTDYSLYHERCVYKDDSITVEFPYESVKVDELQTGVTSVTSDKDGYKKAVVKNFIGTTYLGGSQSLQEIVNLYMSSKDTKEVDIINPSIKVLKDSVVADLDFVKKLEDGTEVKTHDHWSAPRSLVCTTDWESIQEVLSQMTDEEAAVTLNGSSSKEKGYWSWTEETRTISTHVQLYNGETKLNSWTSVVPNKVSYTREGKTHTFDVIKYSIDEKGAQVNLASEDEKISVYDYTDVIEETYGDYTQSSTAPGKIKIANDVVTGYEIRNKVLTVTNSNVNASCDFVTVFKNSESVEKVSKDFPRSLTCTSDWKATEANANEETSQPSATVSATQSKTEEEWSWVEQTRDITATVTLNGSTQYNSWTAKDPNNIKFTKNGVVADFGTIEHSTAKANSSAVLSSTEGLTETYTYDNSITVIFGDNRQNTSAPGTITVTKGKDVTGHEFRNKKLVITDTDVTASLTYVTIYNDGSEDTEDVSKVFPRTLNPYTNWSVNETNASVLTGAANVNLTGSDAKTDGNWSYTSEKRDVTTTAQLQNSNQTNGLTATDPNNIKYTRDGETCEFGTINFSAAEAGQNVEVREETATLSTYDYTDKVTVTFGDNSQTVTLPGTINVAKEKTIVGYEITNQNMTVDQNSVTTSLTFITKWSDGTQDEDFMSKTFARNFKVTTDWSSNEDNANQNTGSASVNLTGSENQSDGDWSYVRETRSINTTATLNGSNQTNGWESSDPNSIVFSKNGVSHSFDVLSFSAQENGATVSEKSKNNEETVYDYTDNISVTFGSNSFDSSAPGKITVKAPWDPDFDHGKFTACVFTTARNEGRDTWVYIASVHFEEGTMPLIIRRSASAPEVNEDYFETNTDNRLNSGTWIPSWGKWINTIATDTPDLMQWDTTDGANADNFLYPTATAWGWDNGYTVSGHPSVTTDKFSASISSDGYVLTIYKGGDVFATYKAAKR